MCLGYYSLKSNIKANFLGQFAVKKTVNFSCRGMLILLVG
jgi:hypothetical protein